MEAVGPTYERLLREANVFLKARIPEEDDNTMDPCMFSTVLREKVEEADIRTSAYWRYNLESLVHFSDGLLGLSALLDDCCFVEVGPHTAMKMPILQTLGDSATYFGTLKRGTDSLSALLELAGNLFNSGYPLSFSRLQALYPELSCPPKILHDLPPHPWHYEKLLWNESRVSREVRARKFPRHELLGTAVPGGNLITFGWRNRLLLDNIPWLGDHKLGDATVFPATAYLAMAVEALLQTRDVGMNRDLTEHTVTIEHVSLPNALILGDQEAIELYTELSPRQISTRTTFLDWFDFQIVSIFDDTPTIRARGTIKLETGSTSLDRQQLPYADCRLVSKSRRMWYESMYKCGLRYGPKFQHMQGILTPDTKDVLYAKAKLENIRPKFQSAQASPRYLIHPAILDNFLQACLVSSTGGHLESMVAKVPKGFGRIRLRAPVGENEGSIQAASTVTGFASNDMDAILLDSSNRPLVHVEKMNVTKYSDSEEMEEIRHPLYRFVWKPDIDHMPNDVAFSAGMNYIRANTDLELLPDPIRSIMMAMDLAVHKDPNADILLFSSDLSLPSLALSGILKADSVHRRFKSFHLGHFNSDGQLEVAELRRYALPFGTESFSSLLPASLNQRFGLVVLSEAIPYIDCLAPYAADFTRILHGGHVHGQ